MQEHIFNWGISTIGEHIMKVIAVHKSVIKIPDMKMSKAIDLRLLSIIRRQGLDILSNLMKMNHSRILAWLLSIIIFIIKSKTDALKEKDLECSDNLISYLNKQLSLANKHYAEVKRQDGELYFARAGIALIHKEKAYISRQVHIGRQKAKSSIYCAIRELRHAEYIAENRNDKNNLRWLNSNLQDLERQLHDGKVAG